MTTEPAPPHDLPGAALPEDEEAGVPRLSWWSFGGALAVVLAIFFLLNPMWRPLDMDAMDRNIAWSYAPIPVLVLALLAIERKLRWSSWALETLKLTLVKFGITYMVANTLWVFTGPPPQGEPPPAAAPAITPVPGRFEPREPPRATALDPTMAGRIAGHVVDAAGAPQADAFVAITAGLEGIVFAPRSAGIVLNCGAAGVQPRRVVVLVYERLALRGAADGLHTAKAIDETGRQHFNVALPPGSEHVLMFDHPLGSVELQCAVHGRAEPSAHVQVVENPFAAWTGSDGRFDFAGVPAGELTLTARGPTGGVTETRVVLSPGASVEPRVSLPAAR